MASKPKDAAPVVDQVLELDPATIDVSGRVGLFYPEKAEAYAALIARDGQRTPITVRRNGSRAKLPWTLVAGLRRGCGRGGRADARPGVGRNAYLYSARPRPRSLDIEADRARSGAACLRPADGGARRAAGRSAAWADGQ